MQINLSGYHPRQPSEKDPSEQSSSKRRRTGSFVEIYPEIPISTENVFDEAIENLLNFLEKEEHLSPEEESLDPIYSMASTTDSSYKIFFPPFSIFEEEIQPSWNLTEKQKELSESQATSGQKAKKSDSFELESNDSSRLTGRLCPMPSCRSEKTKDGTATKTRRWYKKKGLKICQRCYDKERIERNRQGLSGILCGMPNCRSEKTEDGTATKTTLWYEKKGLKICRRCYATQRAEQNRQGLSRILCAMPNCRSKKTEDGTATKTTLWYEKKGLKICRRCYEAEKKEEDRQSLAGRLCPMPNCRSKKTEDATATKTISWHEKEGYKICNGCYRAQKREQDRQGLTKMLCPEPNCLSEKTEDGTATKTAMWYGKNGHKICKRCYEAKARKENVRGVVGRVCPMPNCRSEKTEDGTTTKTILWHEEKGRKICEKCYRAQIKTRAKSSKTLKLNELRAGLLIGKN